MLKKLGIYAFFFGIVALIAFTDLADFLASNEAFYIALAVIAVSLAVAFKINNPFKKKQEKQNEQDEQNRQDEQERQEEQQD